MLLVTAFLLPCLVSVIWFIIVTAMRDKSPCQRILAGVLALAALYFYADANFILTENTDYKLIVYLDMLSQFVTLLLPPMIVVYLRALTGHEQKPVLTFLWFMPAVILGTLAVFIYMFMGVDTAATYLQEMDATAGHPVGFDSRIFQLHRAICTIGYNAILFVEILYLLYYLIKKQYQHEFRLKHIKQFLSGDKKSTAINAISVLLVIFLAICAVRIMIGRMWLIGHPYVSALFSIALATIMFCLAYIGVWFSDRPFSNWDIFHPSFMRAEDIHHVPSGQVSVAQERVSTRTPMQPAPMAPAKEPQGLYDMFVKYMMEKKPYLDPEITITAVADALHSNRTYISIVVNQNFNVSFRDYINAMRIEHSKKLMLEQPDMYLEEVALRSGFASDSQFIKKFREMVGVSPRVWQAEQK